MDNLFKALLIIILVAFLYLYYENSDDDRYYMVEERYGVLDKKTGTYYQIYKGNFISVNFVNGTRTIINKFE